MAKSVAVLGASSNSERYSNRAILLLQQHGHQVFPVNPREAEINGLPCLPSLRDIKTPIHTISVYLRPELSADLIDDIVQTQTKRVIFNPGSESPIVEAALKKNNIPFEHACTLVLLQTGQF